MRPTKAYFYRYHATPSIRKSWYYFAKKRRSLGRHGSLADQSHGVFFFLVYQYIEDGGDTFLRNVGYHSTHYTASYPRRRYSSLSVYHSQTLHSALQSCIHLVVFQMAISTINYYSVVRTDPV
jgi:hypothetical protein